ncbi:uncharacterized protein CANTADRAFT_21133 [Suhomyces tanzawaensis NRRL Y-17324]|uniref:Uncharacterized protein n=1 Tax=Suhomyces tanzawaensis NRRL Y-17324 TaxID=984487 RepID=A0A1E4SK31_9ASCO|nr:uncharacterized protein CANTADRAFT_21133 [Suhomyces tanzawaensis NRRL Y-17324]ODV79850.1 hypothetical protein CANTADRAFT_21133 [Suhomyces tanzawaensis NRRL Y-17324]
MLRSQSISNLSDHRKSKTGGLFSGLRSKKLSMSDLHSIVSSGKKLSMSDLHSIVSGKKTRPLSTTGAASLNSSKPDYKPKLSPISHSSSAAQQRLSVLGENKENIPTATARYKSLKSRSSAPNLSAITHSKPSKNNRTSVLLGGVPISKPIIHADSFSESMQSQSVNSSPITPETVNTVDSLLDLTSIQIYDFENNPDSIDHDTDISDTTSFTTLSSSVDLDEKKSGSRHSSALEVLPHISSQDLKTVNMKPRPQHRTTRLFDVEDFVKLMYSANGPLEMGKLPLNDRDSTKIELQEKAQLLSKLNTENEYSTSLTFLENVELFSITTDTSKAKASFEASVNQMDFLLVLKDDPYNDISEDNELFI